LHNVYYITNTSGEKERVDKGIMNDANMKCHLSLLRLINNYVYATLGEAKIVKCISCIHRVSKNSHNCFWHNFVKFPPTLIIFGTKMAKTSLLCKVHLLTTLPNFCERTICVKRRCSKLLHLRGNYLYQMAHLCIINSTESATWFNNFEVLNILC